jgi:hypothetical protein
MAIDVLSMSYQAWASLSVSGAGPYSIVAKISETVGMAIQMSLETMITNVSSHLL